MRSNLDVTCMYNISIEDNH